jgi:predicted transcriptional regulator of viral defense system
MRFLEFKAHFAPFRVFSTRDIMKWDPEFDTRRLVEWQDKNYVTKLINRWYVFTDEPINEKLLFLIANRIYTPSYVSFESALVYYQLIPEGVYTITSASTLVTKSFDTLVARFVYRHLRPPLFFGYKLIAVNDHQIKMAEPEKVILDYLYLNTSLKSQSDMESLRINKAGFEQQVDVNRMICYLALFKNKSLEERVGCFLKMIGHA